MESVMKILGKAVLAALLPAVVSCDLFEGSEGEIRVSMMREEYVSTKASYDIPDTNDFILEVKDGDGQTIYTGPYGASPESMMVKAGTYNIRAVSCEFTKPQFDRPQFGDEQCVVVPAGGVANVHLVCRQINSGMKLNIASSFLDAYPSGLLYLNSSGSKLQYAYREKRIAYFNPGSVVLELLDGGKTTTLLTKTLHSQEVLVLNVSAAAKKGSQDSNSGGMSIQIDTARTWSSDNYVIGGNNGSGSGGDDYANAMSVTEAKNSIGAKDVWVKGYIVGGDLTSASEGISFKGPWNSATNIAIGPRSTASSKQSCMSVQLQAGPVRDALNLHDNPSNISRAVYIKGDIVSAYYGIPGIKNISEYVLK